jgi:hypothetical protein
MSCVGIVHLRSRQDRFPRGVPLNDTQGSHRSIGAIMLPLSLSDHPESRDFCAVLPTT